MDLQNLTVEIEKIANTMFPATSDRKVWDYHCRILFRALFFYFIETYDKSNPVTIEKLMEELIDLANPSGGEKLDEWIENAINDKNLQLTLECRKALNLALSSLCFKGEDFYNFLLAEFTNTLQIFAMLVNNIELLCEFIENKN